MKKLLALVLALMMVLGMTGAFATGETGGEGGEDENPSGSTSAATLTSGKAGTVGTALNNGIEITKEIIFVNAESTTVREPNITYEYTVAAVTIGETAPTVNDGTTTVSVKSGVIDANTNANHKATVEFKDTSTVSEVVSTGKADSKTFTLNFDKTKFTAAGIYRYSVTESIANSGTKAAVGITEAETYANVRYLDVYVEWADAEHTQKEIYGYVLFEDSTNNGVTGAITTSTTKSQGWVDTDTTTTDTNHTDVDVYTTQNLYLHKTTTGTMADKNQLFTLNYTATIPSAVTATVKIDAAITNGGVITNQETADALGTYINSTNFAKSGGNTVTVKNGTEVSFKGIPAGGTVTVTETNDSPDSYKVKAGTASTDDTSTTDVNETANLLAEALVASKGTSGSTSSQNLTSTVHEYFTNTLDAISPTGYVTRFAPYALILVAGVALLIVAMKKRKNTDEE